MGRWEGEYVDESVDANAKKSLRDKTIDTCTHVYSRILLPRLTFMHPPSNLETHLPTHYYLI